MNLQKHIVNIQSIIKPKLEKLGYDLEYIEYVKEASQYIFRVVIEKKDSKLTTEDCEKASKVIEDIVDKNMKTESSYILEVSSPGLERQLKNIELYKKYIGYKIKLKLYKKINDTKEITGILKFVDDTKVTLELLDLNTEIQVEFKDIANGHTVYNFEEEV